MSQRKPFGQIAIQKGFIKEAQLEQALSIQSQQEGEDRKLLGIVMLEAGLLSNEQLIQILQRYEHGAA